MKVLLISSDWKWTGPAEPMLQLGLGLQGRGHEVALACPDPPDPSRRALAGEAERVGLTPAFALQRGRGARPLGGRDELARLRHFIDERGFEVVHAWHTRDHVMALRACRQRRRTGRSVLLRTYRKGEAIAATPWNRWLFGPGCDGLLCVSPETARRNQRLRGGRPVAGVFGAVDLTRFTPGSAVTAVRETLGLAADDRVVGIVARVQPHRRFDLLLEAARRLLQSDPRARLLVVGRGSQRRELAEEPARRLGIADRVVFAGYRGEDYAEVLRAIDVFTFLVPGSDGSCRALLEAAACGIPAVVSERGALAEIVVDGSTGRVVAEEAGALAGAWRELLVDEALRRRLGAEARKRAETHFAAAHLAEQVERLYDEAWERRA